MLDMRSPSQSLSLQGSLNLPLPHSLSLQGSLNLPPSPSQSLSLPHSLSLQGSLNLPLPHSLSLIVPETVFLAHTRCPRLPPRDHPPPNIGTPRAVPHAYKTWRTVPPAMLLFATRLLRPRAHAKATKGPLLYGEQSWCAWKGERARLVLEIGRLWYQRCGWIMPFDVKKDPDNPCMRM